MVTKARREGQPDDWYLRSGRERPTPADVERVRGLAPKEQARAWRARWGQHCQGWFCNGECPHRADERGCGFLHGEEASASLP